MLSPSQVVDEYYLEVRVRLLEIGAIMDRLDRAQSQTSEEGIYDDPRWQQCLKSLELLNAPSEKGDRAEQIALLFSDHS